MNPGEHHLAMGAGGRTAGAGVCLAALRIVLVAAAMATILSGCGMWSKVTGLFASDNINEPSELPEFQTTLQVRKLWTRRFGDGTGKFYLKFHPFISGDRLFVVDSRGMIGAISTETGKHLWERKLKLAVTAGINGDDSLVAIGTEEGEVIALDPEGGEELWRRQLSSEIMALSRAEQGIIVARTNDSRVYGLNVEDGTVIWSNGRTAPVLMLRGQSVPLIENESVIVGFDDGKLVSFSLERGSVLWQSTIDVPEGRSELERMVDIDGSIRIIEGVIYAVGFHGRAAAIAVADGTILWAREFSSHNGLDVDDQMVFLTDDESGIWALDRRTGASLWKQDKLKYRRVSAPAVVGDYVIAGDYEGYVHWMDKYTGEFVARVEVDDDGIRSQPVVPDEVVFVLGNAGYVSRLEVAGTGE